MQLMAHVIIISLLHWPSKRKEGLLLTACACAKLSDIFPRKISYNTELIRDNILKVIYTELYYYNS